MLATEASLFWNLAELEKFFVGFFLGKLLKFSCSLYVVALYSTMVPTVSYFLYDTSSLNTFGETSDDVCTAFIVIFVYLDVYCHMWARAYHFVF